MHKGIVFITGASSGIGYETALLLKQNGFNVYAGARRIENMRPLEHMGINIMELDISNEKSINFAVQKIFGEVGNIDILINNAGFGLTGAFEQISMSEARYQMEVNFFAIARLTQLVIPKMRESQNGIIVNISSVAGFFGEGFASWYHASKHAVEGLSSSLWRELKPYGIKIIIIQPGTIKTEWDTIAASNLSNVISENDPYRILKNNRKAILSKLYSNKKSSSPYIVANTILRAITCKNPSLHYRCGEGAKPLSWMKKYLGEHTFYKAMDFVVKKMK